MGNSAPFLIELRRVAPSPPLRKRIGVARDDHIIWLMSRVCEALARRRVCDFVVAGFGDDHWPLDIRTDLCTIVCELPTTLAALHTGKATALDFFEQGVERCISITTISSESLQLECHSRTSWKPHSRMIEVRGAPFIAMVQKLRDDFVDIVEAELHDVTKLDLFRKWLSGAAA